MNNLYTPSQLKKRICCHGSAREEAAVGYNKSSEYSLDGDKKHQKMATFNNSLFDNLEKEILEEEKDVLLCKQETVRLAKSVFETYKDGVIVLVEYGPDLSNMGIESTNDRGRFDLALVVPGVFSLLIDYKFGVRYIDRPKYNPQMMAYSIGLFRTFGTRSVSSVIMQPNTMQDEMTVIDDVDYLGMKKWEDRIRNAIEICKKPDAICTRGEHCTFCNAKDQCPAWREAVLSIPRHTSTVDYFESLEPSKRGLIYSEILAYLSWCKQAKECLDNLIIEDGFEVEGFKVVDGNKKREWASNEARDAIAERCEAIGVKAIKLEFISPTEFEKEAGKTKETKKFMENKIVFIEGNKVVKQI